MIVINRKEELQKVFSELDESAKQIVFPMIDDVVFLEKQLRQESNTKNFFNSTITVSKYCYLL